MTRSVYFTAEHAAFREQVRRFVAEEVLPVADGWERDERIPRELWTKMGAAGLLGLNYPRAYGGTERDAFYSAVLLEEIGRAGYGGFRAAFSVHAYMATEYLARAASDDLKRRYLAPAIRGERLAALAISERDAGSDVSRLATSAVRHDDHYLVNGEKMFVTSGLSGDFAVVAVRTGAGGNLSLLAIDLHAPGVTAETMEKLGWRSSDTAAVRFTDVRVPREDLIGREGWGLHYMMQCLQVERLVAALLALGGADACLEITRAHLARRTAFGHPLAAFQALRHRMADVTTELEAARQLTYHAAWLYQQGELPVIECSMAKLAATEAAKHAVDECLQFHGGYGFVEGPMARMYRDTRVLTIVGGASELMRDIIADAAVDGAEYGSLEGGGRRGRGKG